MTRRDFGKGLAAILAAGVAPSVIADGYRRGLAAMISTIENEGGEKMEKITIQNNCNNGTECYNEMLRLGVNFSELAIWVKVKPTALVTYECVTVNCGSYTATNAQAYRYGNRSIDLKNVGSDVSGLIRMYAGDVFVKIPLPLPEAI